MLELLELIKLLRQENKICMEIANLRFVDLQLTNGMEMSQHRRDFHNQYWDPSGVLEMQREDREKLTKLEAELVEVRRKLNEAENALQQQTV